jgi:phosphoribosylformylglycinamidine cyclo-ligase
MQETGKISTVEMYRTFNMGMGYAYVVPSASVDQVLHEVKGAQVVGSVVQKPGAWLGDIEIT